jgi:hypothetical protein
MISRYSDFCNLLSGYGGPFMNFDASPVLDPLHPGAVDVWLFDTFCPQSGKLVGFSQEIPDALED